MLLLVVWKDLLFIFSRLVVNSVGVAVLLVWWLRCLFVLIELLVFPIGLVVWLGWVLCLGDLWVVMVVLVVLD